ncbi:hypothetical protein B0H16DRAFT_1739430 [Mycena metata]|uniref:Uncharacterized protein n=1 Tax=Mycena metata TaxID=1033252 RepID=A0AAD7HFW5_9AGAR|nr:hypothetical protein B0H16DRAFT_1739430 [Mycena metata]
MRFGRSPVQRARRLYGDQGPNNNSIPSLHSVYHSSDNNGDININIETDNDDNNNQGDNNKSGQDRDSDNDNTSITSSESQETDKQELVRLAALWCSPTYGLYSCKVKIKYERHQKYHLFTCSNPKCKMGKQGRPATVCRYLDLQDRTATGNLINHAKSCREHTAVQELMSSNTGKGKSTRDSTIYAAFARVTARIGQHIRSYSLRPQTFQETWSIAESSATLPTRGPPLIIELAQSHTGEALASAFQEVLEDFSIKNKNPEAEDVDNDLDPMSMLDMPDLEMSLVISFDEDKDEDEKLLAEGLEASDDEDDVFLVIEELTKTETVEEEHLQKAISGA